MPKFIFVLVSVLSSFAIAEASQPTKAVRDLAAQFKTLYYSGYAERHCGRNVRGLMETARRAGIDVSRARMLHLTNEGGSMFGMVNAEKARGGFHATTGEQFPPEEKNWYFHVFLELDCYVFDFDFRNEPTVLHLQDYIERMYLDENLDAPRYFQVGREKKLESYKTEVYRGSEILTGAPKPPIESTLWLGELLESCPR